MEKTWAKQDGRIRVTVCKYEDRAELSVHVIPEYVLFESARSRAEAEARDNNSLDAIVGVRDAFRKLGRAFPQLRAQFYADPYPVHRFDISKAMDAIPYNRPQRP